MSKRAQDAYGIETYETIGTRTRCANGDGGSFWMPTDALNEEVDDDSDEAYATWCDSWGASETSEG